MNLLNKLLGKKKRDARFDMENLTCSELFEGLKFGMIDAINNFKFFEGTTADDISLMENSEKRRTNGKDNEIYPGFNLYVKIENEKLSKPASVWFNVDPFEIRLIVAHPGGITTSQPEELTKAFVDFMNTKFPDGKYEKARKKYFKDVKNMYKHQNIIMLNNGVVIKK